jgi:hypothetical protein
MGIGKNTNNYYKADKDVFFFDDANNASANSAYASAAWAASWSIVKKRIVVFRKFDGARTQHVVGEVVT